MGKGQVMYADDIALRANITEELQQATGSTWYADEQEKSGSTGSLKRAISAKAGDYREWAATETNNSL